MGRKCHVCDAPYLGDKICESGFQCPRWQAGGSRHLAMQDRRGRQQGNPSTLQHNPSRSFREPQNMRKCHICEAPYLGYKWCESGLQCPRWQNDAGGSRHRARQDRQGRTLQHNHLPSFREPQIQLPSGSSATSILSLRPVAEELAEERPLQHIPTPSSDEQQIEVSGNSSTTSILSLVAEGRPMQRIPTLNFHGWQIEWSYSTTDELSTSSGSSTSEANTSIQSTSLGSARSLSPSMASSEMSEEWPAGQ
jgi:hypothetical protein